MPSDRDDISDFHVLSDGELLDMVAHLRTASEPDQETDEIAVRLIKDFFLRESYSKGHSRVALGWLAEALGDAIETRDPLSALRLMPRGKHRPAGDGERELSVAMWVQQAVVRGYSAVEAKAMAADLFAIDVKTVGRYIAASGTLTWEPDDDLAEQIFLQRRRPLPPRKAPDKK